MTNKIKKIIDKLPKWNKPNEGKSLTLKEWAVYCFGSWGCYGATLFLPFLTMTSGIYIAAALNINVDHVVIIGIISSVVTIVTSPLASFIIDNTGTKYGKFRPYLIWLPIPIVGLMFATGQILTKIQDYNTMLIVYTIVFNVIGFLYRIYGFAYNSIVQVISPNIEERTQLMSIGAIFASFGPTLVNIVYPTAANMLYSQTAERDNVISGVNTIDPVVWLIPVMAGIFFAIGIVFAFGIKERMVLPKTYVQRQRFLDGVKKTFQNKYFWITNISNSVGVFKMVATSFTLWIIIYMIYPQLVNSGYLTIANSIQAVIVTLIGGANVPGMLLAPHFIKKYGKKNLIIFTSAMTVAFTIPMLLFSNPYALLAFITLVTVFNAFQLVTGPAIQAQIYDYQQYKTHDRLEGFLSQFGTMIATAVVIATAFITPTVYKKFGYIDNSDVLYNQTTLLNIIKVMCAIGIGSGILGIVPYLYYDLNESKHDKIMKILKIRKMNKDEIVDSETATSLEKLVENDECENFEEIVKNISIKTEVL